MTTISLICKKRLLGDMKLLKRDPLEFIDVSPDDKDILIWYFLIKGPESSDYKNGYFIGKIMHNPEYPSKPPDFMMLTPNGRFDIGKKICLSNTGFHSSEWSPMWTIQATLIGFLSIMLDDKEHGISHVHYSKESREIFSNSSVEYNKNNHLEIFKKFARFIDENGNPIKNDLPKQVSEPINNQEEIHVKKSVKKSKKKSEIIDPSTLNITEYTKTDEEYKNLMKNNI
ncbi:ubiquitin-conjugating enzyme E2 [Indivirus ILV1]|uniref:E2 ubiquitin-conjugating enzyme n=1 Tax=Indivirus ILV1 TaxID=1977633 RepID=A0A1V0SDC6_9VIRU|nr:ubiquitin-conjugating enzyme E2 [Indivirus ILV1]